MKVALSPRAEKHFLLYPKSERLKIGKKIYILEEQPFAGKILSGEFAGHRSFRAWPYRIIYSVDQKKQLVLVVDILHRQRAYK